MNIFEKIIYLLQAEMEEPVPWGWFHLMWIGFIIVTIFTLYKSRENYSEKQLKMVLGTYGIIAFILEILKQIIWSFEYNIETGVTTWDYPWYIFPFQFCTTPIFASIICLFLRKNKIRNALLSYMAFFTILGGFMTVIIPDSCFVRTIEINIHTMWLHCGSLVVSIYLMITKEVELNKINLRSGFFVFLIFVGIANLLNILVYNSGILNGETFDMFYISPYFISSLPVFNIIQESVSYIIFLGSYIIAISLGAVIVCNIAKMIEYVKQKGFIVNYNFLKG